MIDTGLIKILNNIALMLEIKGENPFKARAYTNAAEIIKTEGLDVRELAQSGTLGEVKGFGEALVGKISDYVNNGKMAYYEKLKGEVPESLLEITGISGIGPKKAKQLWDELGITGIEMLEEACLNGSLSKLKGFTPKVIEMVFTGIQHKKAAKGRYIQENILQITDEIIGKLRNETGISDISPVDCLRRFSETISTIDILIATTPEVISSYLAKEFKSLPVKTNIHYAAQHDFPFKLLELTGSAEFVDGMRTRLGNSGFDVREDGIFRSGAKIELSSEADIFRLAGLQYIEPELRENSSIIEKAAGFGIPKLIEESDLRGMVHCHTNWSDGKNTIREMAIRTKELGFSYFVVCDHSQTAVYTNGLTPERVRLQHEEIDRLNEEDLGIRILKGIESDILPDGSLDYDEDTLASFDIVVASVHSSFNMPKKDMTRRIICAIQSPYTTMIGHPSGRLLLARPAYEVDIYELIDAAAESGKIIELNANPYRLDLAWEYLAFAKDKGLKTSINPDSHKTGTLRDVFTGVKAARKGGLEASDVVNCLELNEFVERYAKIYEKR
jgi:DNA polymerase (family X)